ncbi:MAG: hypothetical protein ABL982_05245 [Vicinamibacterales bacterium]
MESKQGLPVTRLSKRIEVLCLAVVLPLAFRLCFMQLFSPDRNLATGQDNTYQLVPLFSFLSRSFVQGDYPYWINTIVSGLSIFNDPDFSPAYPFYFLRLDWFRTPLGAMTAIHWITVLHLFVLYVNSYIMMRCLRARPIAAFLGASIFALSQNSVSYAGWINITASYAWLPLIVGAVTLILERRLAWRPVLVGGVAIGLLALASPSQPLIHAVYLVGTLTVFRFAQWALTRDVASIVGATADLALMSILALALAAPSLVPSVMNLGHMLRFLGDFPPITGGARMPFEATLVGQMSPAQLASVLVPLQLPLIVGSWFIGASAVLFALFGLLQARRHWVVAPLAFLTIYALLSSMGSHLGFAQINFHLPFLNLVREPPRHMVVFVLGAAGLAALGFDRVTSAIGDGWRGLATLPHALSVAAFGTLVALASRTPPAYAGTAPLWLMLAAFAVMIGLLLAAVRLPAPGRATACAAAAAVVVAANVPPPHANLPPRTNDYFRQANLASHLTLARLAEIPDIRRFRVVFEPTELDPGNWSMNASYYGLRAFQGFKNPVPDAQQFRDVYQAYHVPRYYPLLGGKYYLCDTCDQIDRTSYRFEREIDGHSLYVADSALPPYVAVGRVAGLYDSRDEFVERMEEGFDIAREVYVDRGVTVPRLDVLLATPIDALHAVIKEERRTLNVAELSVSTNRPAVLVLNEYFTDSWKATINGLNTEPFRVNLNQVGVVLEPGPSLVRFEYRPTVFIGLLRLQTVVVALLFVYSLWKIVRTFRAGTRARRNQMGRAVGL